MVGMSVGKPSWWSQASVGGRLVCVTVAAVVGLAVSAVGIWSALDSAGFLVFPESSPYPVSPRSTDVMVVRYGFIVFASFIAVLAGLGMSMLTFNFFNWLNASPSQRPR